MQFNMKEYGFLLLGLAGSYASRIVSSEERGGVVTDAPQPTISRPIESMISPRSPSFECHADTLLDWVGLNLYHISS